MQGKDNKIEGRIFSMFLAHSIGSFSDVEEMMAIRQATFSSIAKRPHLQERANIDLKVARLYEAKALITVCELSRSHKILQHALSASTHLNKVSNLCTEVALDISAATTLQTASVLWDQGEAISSIRMLQGLDDAKLDIIRQDISVGRAELLATLVCLKCFLLHQYLHILTYVGLLDIRSEAPKTGSYYV